MNGTLYLLHFERRYFHARHYLGWTDNGVDDRISRHLSGQGSPLVRAVVHAGIPVTLARTWNGNRAMERTLKNSKAVPRNFCPLCRAERRSTMLYRTRFTVTGTFLFPFDMLRYEACYPATGQDAARIETSAMRSSMAQHVGPITLEKLHRDKDPRLTPERWRSFQWSIVPDSIQTEKI